MIIKIKKLNKDAIIPTYAYEGDAGMDLCSCEDYLLKAGERKSIKIGISIEFDPGYAACFWDRSGLAIKHGVVTIGGLIDPGYRGEWMVALLNTSSEDYQVAKGDRIAQCLIQPVVHPEIKEVDELSDSDRGSGGFGSSGRA